MLLVMLLVHHLELVLLKENYSRWINQGMQPYPLKGGYRHFFFHWYLWAKYMVGKSSKDKRRGGRPQFQCNACECALFIVHATVYCTLYFVHCAPSTLQWLYLVQATVPMCSATTFAEETNKTALLCNALTPLFCEHSTGVCSTGWCALNAKLCTLTWKYFC